MHDSSNVKDLFQNKEELKSIIIKLVRSGDICNLKLLFQLANTTDPSRNHWDLSKLAEIKDYKQRNLVHIACKYGHKKIIDYLVHCLGLPVTSVDRSGNNPAHILLIYALKSIKSKHKMKRKRSGSKRSINNYIDCCESLKVILLKHSKLLTIPNIQGQKVTDLLQELWDYSSKNERVVGDRILECILFDSNNNHKNNNASNINRQQHPVLSSSSTSHLFKGTGDIDDNMYSFLSDSDDTNNHWEDYFTGFSDKPFKSHLDSIREEFEHRNRTTNLSHKPPKLRQPESGKRSKYSEFPESFGTDEGLLTGRLAKHGCNDHLDENSYETYQVKWKQFLNSDANVVLNYRDVLWPPFCAGDQTNSLESSHIENILKFVQYSTQSLRQLQIDWHPDKFAGRFGTRFKSEAVKNKVMERVVNISQCINKATDYLRNKEESK
ncbi:hypothetical protein MN116_007047 [Schistosoma mekongi]|uniref:NF-kappa-B inhibitor-like protein 1 n=1 Tax=Schistosoma mekongi TaxID=38744 RepID=A0AAE1Z8I2_SCHME|nr:hypothetical protein MN116_007047 [Schistosoma mekongi]